MFQFMKEFYQSKENVEKVSLVCISRVMNSATVFLKFSQFELSEAPYRLHVLTRWKESINVGF